LAEIRYLHTHTHTHTNTHTHTYLPSTLADHDAEILRSFIYINTDIQGSFVEIPGSFAEIHGSLAGVQGYCADLRHKEYLLSTPLS